MTTIGWDDFMKVELRIARLQVVADLVGTHLVAAQNQMHQALVGAGFTERWILVDGGWKAVPV